MLSAVFAKMGRMYVNTNVCARNNSENISSGSCYRFYYNDDLIKASMNAIDPIQRLL